MNKILLAYDGTPAAHGPPAAHRALDTTMELARQSGAATATYGKNCRNTGRFQALRAGDRLHAR